MRISKIKYLKPLLQNHWKILLLILLLLIGTVLRLHRLDYQSFRDDEMITFQKSSRPVMHIITEGVNSWLLYSLVVHPFTEFHNREFWLRIPSALFGSLSILLLYLILCNWLGKSIGLLGSAFMAISPFHVWYSQDARPYTLLIFLSLLSIWLLQLIIKRQKNTWLKLAFVISSAAIFYCHIISIAFIGCLIAYVLLAVPREKWKNWLFIFGGIFLLILPGIYRLVIYTPSTRVDPILSFNPLFLAYAIWTFITGFSLGPSLYELHLPDRLSYVISNLHIILPVMLFFSILFVLGVLKLWRQNRPVFWYNTFFFIFPLAFATSASILSIYVFNVRYAIFTFLPFLIFLAVGVKSLRVNWIRISALSLIGLISIASLTNYFFNERYHKDNIRAVGQFLATNALPNDLVICCAGFNARHLKYYYDSNDLDMVPCPVVATNVKPSQVESDLKSLIADRSRFWLFLCRTYHSDPEGYINKYCEKHFFHDLELKRAGVELILYKRQ